MARVKGVVQAKAKRKKIIKKAKGYFGHKSIGYRSAKEQVRKSQEYAFRDRKQVKRDYRKLWIKRINAATRQYDLNYSQFMHGLKLAKVDINRKMLSEIAIEDLKQFEELVKIAKIQLNKENEVST